MQAGGIHRRLLLGPVRSCRPARRGRPLWAIDLWPIGEVLSDTLNVCTGEQLLVHGAGGITGGLIVALAALRGARSSRRQAHPASSG
jgi:hypothetical protein